MTETNDESYGFTREARTGLIKAPDLDYRPPVSRATPPKIGLIGCGGITEQHLKAYRTYGYEVVGFCDIDEDRARARRDATYPEARATTDHREILADPGVAIVDIATHPAVRLALIEEALKAGKHVLSQKPFVLDLADGERLADLADANGVKLAVNQNGRWAPHFSYIREGVRAGLIGDLCCVDCAVHWDHNWTAGTPFDSIHHLILYDFSIHWFDFIQTLFGDIRAEKVYASVAHSRGQRSIPPLMAQVIIDYPGAQAVAVFNGNCLAGASDRTMVCGTRGTFLSDGPGLMDQAVTLITEAGKASPDLEGNWFPDGMAGTMGELVRAIEDGDQPSHSARNNLKSLELAFAAMASADRGEPVKVGEVRSAKLG